MFTNEKLYTIAEFDAYAAAHPEQLWELIGGRIVEKVVGRKHGKIVLKIGARLIAWVEGNAIQGHYGTEVQHRPEENDEHKLLPDVSFSYGDENDENIETVIGMPDFVVEVKSPSNSYAELREKALIYLQYGTKLVWLVYPSRKIVEVYFADGSSELFNETHVLEGGDVLPKFSMSVRDILE